MDPFHLAVRLTNSAHKHHDRIATRVWRNEAWETHTYAEFLAESRVLAGHLMEWGVQPGDRVALFAHNSPEWSLTDFALLQLRAISVPLYPTSTPDQIRHIMSDSGCMLALVEGASEYQRTKQVWDDLPELRGIFTFDPVDTDDPRVRSLASLLAEPLDVDDVNAAVEMRLADADSSEVASIIYTSGTTGDPKGAMLTNYAFSCELDSLDDFFTITPEDSSLCFLPLSHALERAWTYHVLNHGCMNTYVADARKVAEALVQAKPTMMVSVPRLYEKVVTTAEDKVSSSPIKKKIFEWALRVGGQCQRAYRKGKTPNWYWRAQLPLADRLVLKNVRDAIGGPKKVMACGGAPLRAEVEEFFSACGLQIHPGYGLTEASPLVSFNAPDAFKIGTAGRVMTGGEIKIAAEGEIWYRGPNVMKGYWNNPEATAEVLDEDGWLHTGDVGYVDTDGYLVITDRLKDIIVTSGGKNIAPAPIEGLVLADPLFEQAVVLGDNRPFLTLLVSPSQPHLEELARQMQIRFNDVAELASNAEVLDELRRRVSVATSKLAQHEQIKDLRVAWDQFTLDNGLLTPTLKVRRREVERRFKEMIDDMYARLAERRKRGEG